MHEYGRPPSAVNGKAVWCVETAAGEHLPSFLEDTLLFSYKQSEITRLLPAQH